MPVAVQVKKSVPRFLNRLLGLSLADQKLAFGYFQVCCLLAAVITPSSATFLQTLTSSCSGVEPRTLRSLHVEVLILNLKPWGASM